MILGFIIRSIVFLVSFWLIVEYLFICAIPTWIGITVILSIVLLVILFFTLWRQRHLGVTCSQCKRIEFKRIV